MNDFLNQMKLSQTFVLANEYFIKWEMYAFYTHECVDLLDITGYNCIYVSMLCMHAIP